MLIIFIYVYGYPGAFCSDLNQTMANFAKHKFLKGHTGQKFLSKAQFLIQAEANSSSQKKMCRKLLGGPFCMILPPPSRSAHVFPLVTHHLKGGGVYPSFDGRFFPTPVFLSPSIWFLGLSSQRPFSPPETSPPAFQKIYSSSLVCRRAFAPGAGPGDFL